MVTLWYRAPELLLGARTYSEAVDCWSVGCIMAELLAMAPLLPGTSELSQCNKMFELLGVPDESVWPGFGELPLAARFRSQHGAYSQLRKRFPATSFDGRPTLTDAGFELLSALLAYDPARRMSAPEALAHRWFAESPPPQDEALMPTFPATTTTAAEPRQAHDRGREREREREDRALEKRRRDELAEAMKARDGGLFNFSL